MMDDSLDFVGVLHAIQVGREYHCYPSIQHPESGGGGVVSPPLEQQ